MEKKAPNMGGCQVAGPPGIYYEKVYSKNSNCLLGAVMLFFVLLYLMVLLYGTEMNGLC